MPRKLTESVKATREWKRRKTENVTDIPEGIKRSAIEFFIRRKKEAKEIIELTGIPSSTVYDCIKRFRETGSCAKRNRGGRPAAAVTKATMRRVYHILYRNNTVSMRAIASRLDISESSEGLFVVSTIAAIDSAVGSFSAIGKCRNGWSVLPGFLTTSLATVLSRCSSQMNVSSPLAPTSIDRTTGQLNFCARSSLCHCASSPAGRSYPGAGDDGSSNGEWPDVSSSLQQ